MKKPILIEGIAVVAIAVIGIVAYVALAGNPAVGNNATGAVNGMALNAASSEKSSTQELSVIGPVANLHAGNDGMLYAFTGNTGNNVYAMDPQCNVKWNYTVPGEWRVLNSFVSSFANTINPGKVPYSLPDDNATWLNIGFGSPIIKPVYAVDNGVLYLYIRENKSYSQGVPRAGDRNVEERLLAVANGKLLWNVSIGHEHHVYQDSSIIAQKGRIYVFDDYNVTTFDGGGSVLYTIRNVSSAPAVDENGYVYTVPSVVLDPQPNDIVLDHDSGYSGPANAIEAYNPDGALSWHTNISDPVVRPGTDSQPLYQNGTLWMPVVNGVWAFDTNGNVKWAKHYSGWAELYQGLHLDAHDNIYVEQSSYSSDPHNNAPIIHIIAANGTELNRTMTLYSANGADVNSVILYCTQTFTRNVVDANGSINVTLDMLPSVELAAYDLTNDRILWNRTIMPNGTEVLITDENAGKLIDPWLPDKNSTMGSNIYLDWSGGGTRPFAMHPASVIPGNDAVYVVYQAANYEWPIVIGKTKVDYAGEIYAFDKLNGTLLWERPTSSKVTSVAANNSSIFYGTGDGKVIAQQVGTVAGGTAVAAVAYFFIRFFCLGAVSRARDRLGKNDNRNKVMEYIVINPGSTLHEIAHALGMNVGTVRYHLFILGVNRRTVLHKADGKFKRYFTNSGTYRAEEQFIVSLAKREGIGRLLGILLEKPGLSNGELSRELNMRESNVSRYTAELVEKGIVAKGSKSDGLSSFSIKGEYRDNVALAVRRIGGQ